MLVLVVDTAGSTGSVLLARNENALFDPAATEVLGTGTLQPREFSTQLVSSVAEVFQANQLALSEVDAFAVVSGPGSFTGLRVGLSAVKALAEATAKPIVALSRLAVMASMAAEPKAEPIHAVLDACRGEFYYGLYRDHGWIREVESLQTPEELAAKLKSMPGIIVASEPTVWNALTDFSIEQITQAGTKECLPLVLRSWKARRFRDISTLDANYLRRSDAEFLRKSIVN